VHNSVWQKGRLESCEDGPLREGPREEDPSPRFLEGGLSHWEVVRAVQRAFRAMAECRPLVRSKSLAEPETQPASGVEQGSRPRRLSLHGSPLTGLAALVLHSALTPSTTLFSSTGGAFTARTSSRVDPAQVDRNGRARAPGQAG
jgi:hypothetical protein